MTSLRSWALVLALLAAPPAVAQEARPLSLREALDLAQAANPDLHAARAQADAQALRAEAVGRLGRPRLAAGLGFTHGDNPAQVFAQKLNAGEFTAADFALESLNDPQALSHWTTTLTLEAPVDVFGRIGAAARAQTAAAEAGRAVSRQAEQDVRLRVIEAYHQAALAGRAVEVTLRALDGARSREADVEARVSEGAALGADRLRARARRRQREADVATARGEARVAAAGLARLLGAPLDSAWNFTDAPPSSPAPADDASVRARLALERRASVEAARRAADAASWALRAEQRARLPELALWGQVQDDRNGWDAGKRTATVGAQVRWSAFDPSRSKRAAAAAAEARAAERRAQAAVDQARLEVEAAFARVRSARERLDAARGGAEEGREALRVVQERRQSGLATLTDELETEAAALMAELEELRAATAAALAEAALEHAAGDL